MTSVMEEESGGTAHPFDIIRWQIASSQAEISKRLAKGYNSNNSSDRSLGGVAND